MDGLVLDKVDYATENQLHKKTPKFLNAFDIGVNQRESGEQSIEPEKEAAIRDDTSQLNLINQGDDLEPLELANSGLQKHFKVVPYH